MKAKAISAGELAELGRLSRARSTESAERRAATKLSDWVRVRLHPRTVYRIEQAAAERGYSISDFVRDAISRALDRHFSDEPSKVGEREGGELLPPIER